MHFFDKTKGNDVWECLYFTKNFNSMKDKFIETGDCKISWRNVFYTLIGTNTELQ